MIKLGVSVKDKVSGFEGLVLAKMESLYEATQWRVHPAHLDGDGKIIDSMWLEEGRLEVIRADDKPLAGFLKIAGGNH